MSKHEPEDTDSYDEELDEGDDCDERLDDIDDDLEDMDLETLLKNLGVKK